MGRVAVMGAGAVDCYYGFKLARAGHDVVLIGRPQHVEAVEHQGLRLETQTFDEHIRVSASTEGSAAQARSSFSLGIVCASLVSTIVFPRRRPAAAARVDNWLSDARRLSQDVLTGRGTEQASRDLRLRIAADAVEIDTLASHLAYDRTVDIDAARGLTVNINKD